MADEAKKAAPKRKTTARKSTARKSTVQKTTARKTTAKRKPAARKSAPRKATARKVSSLQSRVTEAGRSAFLASLGFYGMAFDQIQEQYKSVESDLAARRKKADKLYADMVKRGERVEKKARSAIDDIELPKLDVRALDRAKVEARLEKARARFEEFKDSVGFRAAA